MSEAIRVLKAVQMFLAFCAARNDSQHTLRAYNRDLLSFVQFIGHETPVSEVSRKQIRHFLFSLDSNLKNSSMRRKVAAIRSFCKWLVMERYVETSPSEGISGPRLHRELPDIPSESDMAKLLSCPLSSACPQRDQVILELLYSCGLRASEVAGANVEDINGGTLLVHGKGKKERLVPIGRKAQEAIAEWMRLRKKFLAKMKLETKSLLFSVRRRESLRLDVRSIRRVVRRVALAKGLPPYHPHQLRHAFATHCHDHGAPLQAVALMLGHVHLSTTQIYTRVSTTRMLDVYRKAHPHAVRTNASM